MNSSVPRGLTASLVALLLLGVGALADRPRPLPDFALRDPTGRLHTRSSLASSGAVVLVTAPTLASEEDQRAWDAHLVAARPDGARAHLVFVEDMQQSWFPDAALKAMREEYDPAVEPVVLVDRRGDVRRALRIDEGRTVLLAFDAAGVRRYVHTGSPGPAAAERAWAAAEKAPYRAAQRAE